MSFDVPAEIDVATLLRGAKRGDEQAWRGIVARFTPLVVAICRSHGLSSPDTLDVSQVVWLRLVEHLERIRELEALAGWIAVTTRNECMHTYRSARRRDFVAIDFDRPAADVADTVVDRQERRLVLEAFGSLGDRCRELLSLLVADPPVAYSEIAVILDLPVGSIGPTRQRCIENLRKKLHLPAEPKDRL